MRRSEVGGGADNASVEFGMQVPGVTYGAGVTSPAEVTYIYLRHTGTYLA